MNSCLRFTLAIIFSVLFAVIANAQNPISNPGFENWTQGEPDFWTTNDVPGYYTTFTQTNIRHSGNFAIKGEVVSYAQVNLAPLLIAENGAVAVSQNYTRMTGYYQMTNLGEDALYSEVLLTDAQSGLVAFGAVELGPTSGGYQLFTIDLEYVPGNQQPAASAYIYFVIALSSTATVEDVTLGSSFLLDDVAFDMASSVENQGIAGTPLIFALGQNYPNPFNPATTITFSLPVAEKATLTIYNGLGQAVRTLVDEDLPAGLHQVTFDASALPSGIYYYKLEAGIRSTVKRMMVIK